MAHSPWWYGTTAIVGHKRMPPFSLASWTTCVSGWRRGVSGHPWRWSLRRPLPPCHGRRAWRSSSSTTATRRIDLRSDTVTAPSPAMLQAAQSAPTGDDVLGEDPTVQRLEAVVAERLGMDHGLFVPTGTMSNLVAIMAHCHTRAAEMVVGAGSHIAQWEGGNAAGLAGVHPRFLPEDAATAQLDLTDLAAALRHDNDDHFAETKLVVLENSHNLYGGRPLSVAYVQQVKDVLAAHKPDVALHVDGARLFNAATALGVPADQLAGPADSVSVCLSKGLGAPLGSVLVTRDAEVCRLAKRARKRCGGGMRQAGVVAAMGLYAVEHNVARLAEDHARARYLAEELHRAGYRVPEFYPPASETAAAAAAATTTTTATTNIVYFGLPPSCDHVPQQTFVQELADTHGVQVGGGYRRPNQPLLLRAVLHLDVTDDDVTKAAAAFTEWALRRQQ